MIAWFYRTSLYYKFRYYFIRRKAPLSWIWWGEVMRRESSSQGMYQVSIAAVGQSDAAISLSRGAPGDNTIEITIYDGGDTAVETVRINLSYRDMGRVMKGFNEAFRISRKQILKEHRDASGTTNNANTGAPK
jgi:hypothetical protein